MSIRFYKDREVRAVWDDETNKWWFSAVDVVAAINEESDYKKAGNYWRQLKMRNKDREFVTNSNELKMTADDGKRYTTAVLDQTGISQLARSIHNKKANEFLEWFEYSDKTIDGRSQKKAYELFDSPVYDQIEVGTTKGLQQIHAFIFGGLYDYAGKIRTKNIAKDSFQFAPVQFLDQTLRDIEAMPENTFDEIIDKYVEMNIAHPFMEGNGRSTRIWLDLILKKNLAKCVDWSQIEKQEYLDAMKHSTVDSSEIKRLIKAALTDKINDREMFMKGIDYSYYYEQPEQ
jgi:cell filamentation protein